MEKLEFSQQAIKYYNDYKLLYYFNTGDTISLILVDKKMPRIEVLLRNFIEPNVIHFQSEFLGTSKKTKEDYNWWNSNHKHFTKQKDWFWRNRGFVKKEHLQFL